MKRVIVIIALVVAALGAIAIRVVIEGRSALGDGDDWMARGKSSEAIRSYEAAARWYLPFAPHVDDAYDRLRVLTRSEDPAVGLAAWRSIRAAARATRSLWTPHADELAAADEAIASRSAREPAAGPAGNTTAEREAWHRGKLARDSRPSPGAVALAALGIVAWVGGAFGLARRGLSESGALVRRPAVISGIVIVLGIACWLLGLYNA